MTYGGYHNLPSHLQPIPNSFNTHFSLFWPKNDIFSYLKKKSSSGSAQKLLGPLKMVSGWPMVATTTYPAIYSLFQIFSTPFSAYFRPKNYIFTYFKKDSSSGSAQKLLGPFEMVPGWHMVATTTYPANYSLFQILSTHFSAYFDLKMTFSPISKRNQALVQLRSY